MLTSTLIFILLTRAPSSGLLSSERISSNVTSYLCVGSLDMVVEFLSNVQENIQNGLKDKDLARSKTF